MTDTLPSSEPHPASPAFTLALLPLDERPVNVALPRDIAAIAGARLELPPAGLMPRQKTPGDADRLAGWLEQHAATADSLIVSLDMLAYGGLIASRTTADRVLAALGRIEALRRIRAGRPGLPIAAVSLVMRASNSYNTQEEPDYWAEYGKKLHELGGLHHRDFLDRLADRGASADDRLAALRAGIPADTIADFELRRLRNHQVNLEALALLARGVLDTLLITADDTAEFAAGSLEQLWLGQWTSMLPAAGTVLMYPGADEVAGVLVARQLAGLTGTTPRFALAVADEAALGRVAKYENSPARVSVERQVRACGAELVTGDAAATAMALVVHAPDPERRDMCVPGTAFTGDDAAEACRTADLVERLLDAGREVALADLRYANGADPMLLDRLAERGVLLNLGAYGGWNTAGNALGSVVAAAAAMQVGRAAGTFDPGAARRLLLRRITEDYFYMSRVRPGLEATLREQSGTLAFTDAVRERASAERVEAELDHLLAALAGDSAGIEGLGFPWHRSFEIDFAVTESGR